MLHQSRLLVVALVFFFSAAGDWQEKKKAVVLWGSVRPHHLRLGGGSAAKMGKQSYRHRIVKLATR